MESIKQKFEPLLNESDYRRIEEISKHLKTNNRGFGAPISDREFWGEAAKKEGLYKAIGIAEEYLTEPIPELTDEIYLRYSTIGDRQVCDKICSERNKRIDIFTIAEGIENKGRFIKAYEETVIELCSQKTWAMTAHDGNLDNFYGRDITIDLGSAMISLKLATADYILGERVSPQIRKLIRDNIEKRTFVPFKSTISGERAPFWWMCITTNNWNAVCLSCVVASGLTLIQSPGERALYITAFEKYIKNFLKGFTEDGYCSEGLSYWGYGFSHFLMGAEIVRLTTSGFIDLFKDEKVKKAALFGLKSEIINGIYPSIADCAVGTRPLGQNMYFISKRYGLGLEEWERNPAAYTFDSKHSKLYLLMMLNCIDTSTNAGYALEMKDEKLRSWFDEAGVLICRHGTEIPGKLGVVLKGGHNNEHHNHNDVGNFIVVLGKTQLIVDPGHPPYTKRTFSKDRYLSNVLNSYGHSVPVIAGRLQSPYINPQSGEYTNFRARVLCTEFSDREDKFSLDLRAAYEVESLERLERTFVYSREGNTSLTVTDDFRFSCEETFETALITFGNYNVISDNILVVYQDGEAIKVEISSDCRSVIIADEIIREDLVGVQDELRRISIKLIDKVKFGKVSLKIYPANNNEFVF